MNYELLPLYEAIALVYLWYSVDSACAAAEKERPIVAGGWAVCGIVVACVAVWMAARGGWI